MTTFALLAPGPSLTADQCERVRHLPCIAVGNAFQLAPWAPYLVASDAAWWRKYPEALALPAEKFCMATNGPGERVLIPQMGQVCNSGVAALEVAKRLGATRALLLGFDQRGSHFFGEYQNGLRNTKPHQREQHKRQFSDWGRLNRSVQVLNCTPKSALTCFPSRLLDDVLTEIGEVISEQGIVVI